MLLMADLNSTTSRLANKLVLAIRDSVLYFIPSWWEFLG